MGLAWLFPDDLGELPGHDRRSRAAVDLVDVESRCPEQRRVVRTDGDAPLTRPVGYNVI